MLPKPPFRVDRASRVLALAGAAIVAAAGATAFDVSSIAPALAGGVSTAPVDGAYRVSGRLGLRPPAGPLAAGVGWTGGEAYREVGGIGLLGDFHPADVVPGLRLSAGGVLGGHFVEAGAFGIAGESGLALGSTFAPRGDALPVVAIGYDDTFAGNGRLSAYLGARFGGDFGIGDGAGRDAHTDLSPARDDVDGILPYVRFSVSFRF